MLSVLVIETYDTDAYDGIYVALIAPLEAGGYEIDSTAYRELLQYYMDNDSFRQMGGGFVVNPEAGEIHTLTREERRHTVEMTVDVATDDVNVFAGVSAMRRDDLVQYARDAVEAGVDGLFVMPPEGAMEVTTRLEPRKYPEIWVNHVRSVAEAVDVPLIIHPTGVWDDEFGPGLPLEVTRKLVTEIPSIVGWKMTYRWGRGYEKIARFLRYSLDRHVSVLTPGANLYHNALEAGFFDGTLSAPLNYGLEPMLDHIAAMQAGDLDRAKEIQRNRLRHLNDYTHGSNSRYHIRFKVGAWARGRCAHPFMRPPLPTPTEEELRTVHRLLTEYTEVDTIDRAEVDRTVDELEDWKNHTPPA